MKNIQEPKKNNDAIKNLKTPQQNISLSSQSSLSTPIAQLQGIIGNKNASLTPSNIMDVQRSIGNQATAQLVKSGMQIATTVQHQAMPKEDGILQQKVVQKKENKTGLPDDLKSGVENLSGMEMDDVKVHYNSDKPSQLNALAYAQGEQIHVGPGQEQHLPHEAWHVVQQREGRVKPTLQMEGGVSVNDDPGLEREADVMGEKAKG